MVPPAEFRSYYGRPILKAAGLERTTSPTYLFTGGLAAGSTLLAAGADLTGRPALRRGGRIAALAALLGAAPTSWSTTWAGRSASTTCCGWPSRPRR